MDRHLHAAITLAAWPAALVLGCALLIKPPPVKSTMASPALEHCRRAAELLHDVHWAAACVKNPTDDQADCMLPDAQAARVNALLGTEEARCLATEERLLARATRR